MESVTSDKSTFKYLGVLKLPMFMMMSYGVFGFRPGQLMNKIFGHFVNLFFLFNYILSITVGIGYLISNDGYKETSQIFLAIFCMIIIVKFTCLFHKFYKQYNMVCLFRDRLHVLKLDHFSKFSTLNLFCQNTVIQTQ